VLVKGPAGAVLPALVATLFLASGGDLGRLAGLWSARAAAAAGALAGGWYLAALVAGGREFLAVQVLKENIDRFAGRGEFAPHRTPPVAHAAHSSLPGAVAPRRLDDLRRWWRGNQRRPADACCCWWIVVLVVFTVAAGKRRSTCCRSTRRSPSSGDIAARGVARGG
jgi:4-amino-4-deoxy-L-arabinose transferase-like glycosyltransferase